VDGGVGAASETASGAASAAALVLRLPDSRAMVLLPMEGRKDESSES
jgi:hypothetical protein